MQFGLNFFPCVGPEEKSAAQYFRETLDLAELGDRLGLAHVRQVEHYFHPYGGYSPNPLLFLAAVAQRTKNVRLVTGAVLPAFNNPLKLAGEIGMLDGISGGRLDVGFARAFLPHEFETFGVSLDESRRRFTEGVTQIKLLLTGENVSHAGEFHRFANVTSLPRPTQMPHPPFWVAAVGTPQSFSEAGRNGYNLMTIPIEASKMFELYGLYREAWQSAGHPGRGTIMSSFFLCCAESREQAYADAREPINGHIHGLADSASGWMKGASTKDYPGYDKIIAQIASESFEQQVEKSFAWVGTPDDVLGAMTDYDRKVGGFEIASLLVMPSTMPAAVADRTVRLFSEKVMPRVAKTA